MGEVCTCGTAVLPDARFCHKCGRPLRDEPVLAEERIEEPAPVSVAASDAPRIIPIGFRNSAAVRVAIFAAAMICLLVALPAMFSMALPTALAAVWQTILLLAGGFVSVYLYTRRTGQFLSMGSGARMGWLTGIFCFVIVTIFFTLVVVIFSNSAMIDAVSREMQSRNANTEAVEQLRTIVQSPANVIFVLLSFFVLLTSLPTIGGALGAKVLEKD